MAKTLNLVLNYINLPYRYKVEHGKLLYKNKKGLWTEVILSKSQQIQIIQACHSDATAGHLGRTKTFYKVSERYYWPGIFDQVAQVVSDLIDTKINSCT